MPQPGSASAAGWARRETCLDLDTPFLKLLLNPKAWDNVEEAPVLSSSFLNRHAWTHGPRRDDRILSARLSKIVQSDLRHMCARNRCWSDTLSRSLWARPGLGVGASTLSEFHNGSDLLKLLRTARLRPRATHGKPVHATEKDSETEEAALPRWSSASPL